MSKFIASCYNTYEYLLKESKVVNKSPNYFGFTIVGSLIGATIVFLSTSYKANEYVSQVSQFGGYKGDGNYSLCEKAENTSIREYCIQEKHIPLIKKSPLFPFIVIPPIMIFVYRLIKKMNENHKRLN